MRPVFGLLIVLVLVSLGYLAGRGRGDLRSSYLHIVSFLSLLLAALGVIVALDGLVRVALPSQARYAAGPAVRRVTLQPRVLRDHARWPMPMRPGDRMKAPDATPAPPGAGMMQGMDGMQGMQGMMESRKEEPEKDAADVVRGAGLVQLLRGLILFLVAGAVWLYHWRRAEPRGTPPSAAPAPEAPAAQSA